MSKTKHNDWSWSMKVCRPCSSISKCGNPPLEWHKGYITTKHGIVGVYYQDDPKDAFTRLDFVANGREHTRNYERVFSKRYLVTLASRFAAEMSGGGK